MSTRSTTLFIEKGNDYKTGKVKKTKLVKFYRQSDGYPEGHGLDLANFLNDGELVNGIGIDAEKIQFNGIGCLAAALIKEVKNGPGGVYIVPVSDGPEQYNYEIVVLSPWYKGEASEPIVIRCKEGNKLIFEGTPQAFVDKYTEVTA
jgi:hypothetical protein